MNLETIEGAPECQVVTHTRVEMPGMWNKLNLAFAIQGMLRYGGTPERVGLVVFDEFLRRVEMLRKREMPYSELKQVSDELHTGDEPCGAM